MIGGSRSRRHHVIVLADRQGGHHHRLVARHRPRHRRADGRARRQGGDLVAQGRACEEVARRDQRRARRRAARSRVPANISSKDDLQHLVDETTRRSARSTSLVCNAASNPYYGPLGGIADDQFRKILENNIIANHWLISFAAPQMIERKDGVDHHRLVDRRPARLAGDRRLLHLQGGRLAAGAQPGRRVRAAQRPGQLHRARAWSRPTSPSAVGRPRRRSAPPPARRCAASASPTRSPARRSSWPRRPAPS